MNGNKRTAQALSFDLMENMIAQFDEKDAGEEDRSRLLRALNRAVSEELTPRQAQCVAMYYGDRIRQRDIALQLGVAPSTVCRHLKKARSRLAHVLRYYF